MSTTRNPMPPMVAGMRSTLAAMGVDISSEIADSSIVLSSEPVTTGAEFEIDVMLRKLEDSIDQALKDGYKGLWASGDMTWEFGSKQNFDKLIEYELKLEELFSRRKELRGICQYHKDTMPHESLRQGLLMHPGLVINQTLSRINPHYLKSAWPVDSITRQQLDETISLLCGS